MQLDLFSDNRRTIRLNDAWEHLRVLRLEEALGIYAELLAEAPEDRELLTLWGQVEPWRDKLSAFQTLPVEPEELHGLWLNLTPEMPPPLLAALRERLIEDLLKCPAPERIYIPPSFHLGTLLLTSEKFSEAEHWLNRALQTGIGDRSRFMAWRGDALLRLGEHDRAKEAYLSAFLENPRQVDLESMQSSLIQELLVSLEVEGDDFEVTDLPAWLPVWGWLQGEFGLRMDEVSADPATFAATLEAATQAGNLAPARRWFDCLRYAEYLRTLGRNDRELVRVRRWMQQLNRFMFEQYMKKIREDE